MTDLLYEMNTERSRKYLRTSHNEITTPLYPHPLFIRISFHFLRDLSQTSSFPSPPSARPPYFHKLHDSADALFFVLARTRSLAIHNNSPFISSLRLPLKRIIWDAYSLPAGGKTERERRGEREPSLRLRVRERLALRSSVIDMLRGR